MPSKLVAKRRVVGGENGFAGADGMQRILSLQQRFAGELGTEERAQIHQPLQDALVIVLISLP